nr:MAG TPA: hypothetical protein [Caudoviricetes sp.]DAS16959.1 MAG TPA: hypothetical protein [Caudoviricetes sp.]
MIKLLKEKLELKKLREENNTLEIKYYSLLEEAKEDKEIIIRQKDSINYAKETIIAQLTEIRALKEQLDKKNKKVPKNGIKTGNEEGLKNAK